jgi:hypothetical protein
VQRPATKTSGGVKTRSWQCGLLTALLGFSLAACSAIREEIAYIPAPIPAPAPPAMPSARIVIPPAPLQCVPFARQVTGIEIRGDAWTWWEGAEGIYRRSRTPVVGAVLVLKRTARLRFGHLAVVTGIIGDREILVDQANWLNRGSIHLSTPVRDVSANNDWSAVRVWYTPGRGYGARTYAAHGFIYPGQLMAAEGSRSARAGASPRP